MDTAFREAALLEADEIGVNVNPFNVAGVQVELLPQGQSRIDGAVYAAAAGVRLFVDVQDLPDLP